MFIWHGCASFVDVLKVTIDILVVWYIITSPWTNPTHEQKAKIEQTAQAILDARALYPDSSLADLYDDLTMPVELRKAHQDNDRAVMAAYGFPIKGMTESQCVAELFKLYQELINTDK